MKEQNCSTCRYFNPSLNQCRNGAPRLRKAFNEIESQTFGLTGIWPLVKPTDYCGHWKHFPNIKETKV